MKPGWLLAYGVFIGLLAAGAIYYTSQPRRGEAVELWPPPTAAPIQVHVSGEVNAPGVVTLEAKSRVRDAVQAAGDFTAEADAAALNMAAVLVDGQKIIVPAKNQAGTSSQGVGQAGSSQTPAKAGFPIDINTADQQALESLPGIGPVTAAAIIQHRQQKGLFKSLEDLESISGIGPATIAAIKDWIVINP
jgi:competence protein ComEA